MIHVSLGAPLSSFALSPQYDFAGDASGSTYSTSAFMAAMARKDDPTVTIGPGTYKLACSLLAANLSAASAVSLEGSGEGISILRFDSGCAMKTPLATWDGKSRVRVRNLTIDFNTPAPSRLTQTGLAFFAYSGNVTDLLLEHLAVINTTSPVLNIGIAASGGFTYRNITVRDSHVALSAAKATQNQCIALTTVDGRGLIKRFRVSGNTCVASAIQIDGTNGRVDHNDVSDFKFGSGIFVAGETRTTKSAGVLTIDHNVIHDAPATCDVNGTPPAGVENTSDNVTISGNLIHHLGGEGIRNYGRHVSVVDNLIFDNGSTGSGCGPFGVTTQSGIHIGYARAFYDSVDVIISGNHVYDDGAGTQLYGYIDDPLVAGPVILLLNNITGVRQALKVRSSPGVFRQRSRKSPSALTLDREGHL